MEINIQLKVVFLFPPLAVVHRIVTGPSVTRQFVEGDKLKFKKAPAGLWGVGGWGRGRGLWGDTDPISASQIKLASFRFRDVDTIKNLIITTIINIY